MKTAISIPDNLFAAVEKTAKELKLSRSQLFVAAVKDYLVKQNNRELLEALNEAYSEADTKKDMELRKRAKKYYSRLAKAERW